MGPGPYGLGPYGLIGAKGQIWSNKYQKIKVLRMGFSIVENLSGSGDIIFNLFRGPQLDFGEQSKSM